MPGYVYRGTDPEPAPLLAVVATFDADELRDQCLRAELAAIRVHLGDMTRLLTAVAGVVDIRLVTP